MSVCIFFETVIKRGVKRDLNTVLKSYLPRFLQTEEVGASREQSWSLNIDTASAPASTSTCNVTK